MKLVEMAIKRWWRRYSVNNELDINGRDSEGGTPLTYAVVSGHLNIVNSSTS